MKNHNYKNVLNEGNELLKVKHIINSNKESKNTYGCKSSIMQARVCAWITYNTLVLPFLFLDA
jgi:hypothetical protein